MWHGSTMTERGREDGKRTSASMRERKEKQTKENVKGIKRRGDYERWEER